MSATWQISPAPGLVLSVMLNACLAILASAAPDPTAVAQGVLQVGRIEPKAIKENSGLVASRTFPGVFWTHNDGGGPKRQVLYAITRQGKGLAEFPVAQVTISDWEDLAIDDTRHLYLADTGNNDATRDPVAVHQIDEPDPNAPKHPISPRRTWLLRFPGRPFDCESLFVLGDWGYLISKVSDDQRAQIFRFPLTVAGDSFVLQQVTQLPITSPVTGADLSADGKWLGVVCKAGAYVFRIDGDVARAGTVPPWHQRFRQGQIEGCCFVADGLLCSSESREIFLFTNAPASTAN